MNDHHTTLPSGQPVFDERGVSQISSSTGANAAASGGDAAWWRAMNEGPAAVRAAAAEVRGDFAVGMVDAKGRGFLAVDRFGVRTLCYAVVDGALKFSERADDPRLAGSAIDPQALFNYLYFHAIPSPRTVFKGVQRLPPGHFAWFDGKSLSVKPYWSPRFEEPTSPSYINLRDSFRNALRDAVARQLDGGVPACFLSGGTDSSTIAGMIGEVTDRPARCYSIGFEAEGYDEMAYARIAARHFGCDHREYYLTPDDLVRSIPAVAAHYDQPFGNSSALPAYLCALRAHEDGVTRLLAGDGGDELFGGNSRYAKQRVFGLYDKLPVGLRRRLLEPALAHQSLGRVPVLRKVRSYVEQARVPLPDRLQMYNLLCRLGISEVLTPELLEQVDQQAPKQEQRTVWNEVLDASELNRMLAYDWRYTLAESDLPKVRGSTDLAGISVGYPFLDHAVLELSLRLPSRYKLKGLKLRWFFKEALRGFLPDEILAKKKHGFGLPFGMWVNRHRALNAMATDSLHAVAERGIVRPEFVRSLLQVHLPAHPGYYGEMVWILMMLEQWLQAHQPMYRTR
jgi:asparagine synthase (glutamine-hydrolysing)